MGRPEAVKPHGTLIPGGPARLRDSVSTSDRYMPSGSSTRSPIFHAGDRHEHLVFGLQRFYYIKTRDFSRSPEVLNGSRGRRR